MMDRFSPPVELDENEKAKKETEKTQEKTIYGKEKFKPEDAREYVEKIVEDFEEYFHGLGYVEHASVPITSGFDPTVRFIGSHISVFKPLFVDGTVPNPGSFLRQDCVRTRNADRLLDDEYLPRWGSYFPSLGTISPPERLNDVCKEAFQFFLRQLKIPVEYLKIRVHSSDTDLLSVCQEYFDSEQIEVDTMPIGYYRHKLGLDDVSGRNFNIALRDSDSDKFSDVGNVILIENSDKKLGVEVALGSTTILKQLHGLDHVLDCTPVVGVPTENEATRRKFEDAIITSTVFFREGLRPIGQHNRNRICKQYVRSLSYFRAKDGIPLMELAKILSDFERREFPGKTEEDVSTTMIEYVRSFENELKSKKDRTEEEEKIAQALNAYTE